MRTEELERIKKECLDILLDIYKKANAGHIGSSLSCLDILIFLYFYHIDNDDLVILSKGHAAAALYTVLYKKGILSKEQLDTYYQDGTILPAHPTGGKIPEVPFGTGSLGHGLSLAAGVALAKKLKKDKGQVFCIVSEGDLNEGSTWEAVMFAAHHHLDNMTVIFDNNGLQAFGFSDEVVNLHPIGKKWESFNFNVSYAEGNVFSSLVEAFKKDIKDKKPRCVIAKTRKGSGVSYMENKMEWHYLPMNDEQYEMAKSEVVI